MKSLPITVALCLAACAGGSSEAPLVDDACPTAAPFAPSVSDTCSWAKDGECDEPANCALGTDQSDCASACGSGAVFALGAACAWRTPPAPASCAVTPGSGGSLHWVGHHDGVIEVPAGANPSQLVNRHYRVFVPLSYDPSVPAPLLIMMPGNRADIYWLADWTALQRTAELNRFIVVYAEQEWRQVYGRWMWSWWTDWDWSQSTVQNPDLIFLRRLIERMEGEYNIDTTRVLAAGHSRGGAMALIAAFELSDIVAGACSQSGFAEFNYHAHMRMRFGRRPPVVLVHGARDTDVPIGLDACDAQGRCIKASDALAEWLTDYGWSDNELFYLRLTNAGHRWQPQLNQQVWDFLAARPWSAP